MQVKKFEAPTIQEALENIKRELGPEAIILQTKKNKGGFGLMSKASVEVTAAVSDRSLQKKTYVEHRMPEQVKNTMKNLTATRQADMQDKYVNRQVQKAAAQTPARRLTATRYIDIDADQIPVPAPAPVQAQAAPRTRGAGAIAGELGTMQGLSVEDEVKHLKRMIEEMKSAQELSTTAANRATSSLSGSGAQSLMTQSAMQTPALQDAFEQLVINGLDKRWAHAIVKKVGFELGGEGAGETFNPETVLDQVAGEIMATTQVAAPLASVRSLENSFRNGPTVIALVGPTGVGKTTTVAKMASEALLRRNLKVGLINLDTYKIAAFDQLGTYAKILNVPFRSAATAEDLRVALDDFQKLDLVLIDTTGRSQRDPGSLKEMQDLLGTVQGIRTQMVLSVTTRDTELYDMATRFSVFHPEGVIFSKLDEATLYGSIYNLAQKVKLPLLYFTTGQRVPEDIEEATRERVAALILDLA